MISRLRDGFHCGYDVPASKTNEAGFSSLSTTAANSRYAKAERLFHVLVCPLMGGHFWGALGLAGAVAGLLTHTWSPTRLAAEMGVKPNLRRHTMSNLLSIGTFTVREFNGLYSLNDLHKAAENLQQHRPKYWLENKQTQDLIREIQKGGITPFEVRRGVHGGTYACRELVIAYAAWISAAFHLKVIRVFLNTQAPQLSTPREDTRAKEQALFERAHCLIKEGMWLAEEANELRRRRGEPRAALCFQIPRLRKVAPMMYDQVFPTTEIRIVD